MTIATGESAQMIVVGNRGMTGARRVLGSGTQPSVASRGMCCADRAYGLKPGAAVAGARQRRSWQRIGSWLSWTDPG